LSKGEWPCLPRKNGEAEIAAQESPRHGARMVRVYVFYPGGALSAVTRRTGLFLSLHNWGGTRDIGAPNPETLADRYNVVAICLDYLQSGPGDAVQDRIPYDLGYWQALDALRSLYYVRAGLRKKGIGFDRSRTYVAGGSGGGTLSLMVNKLAPRTFACVVDLSGLARLTDAVAFAPPGNPVNARWSRDPESPNYLPKDAQQIRNPGHPAHLAVMKSLGSRARVICIHGVDDPSCLIGETRRLIRNMRAAGLEAEPHYVRKRDVDGDLFLDSGHGIGDRTRLLIHFADQYFSPGSPKMRRTEGPPDFDWRDEAVRYATKAGAYVISYKEGYPIGRFIPRQFAACP
jgi:predicted esterase